MTRPILYSFRRCPYAMRGRMALHAARIEVEHREIILRDKPAAMLAASPKGTVPVLVLPDGRVIDESLDLMHWALSQNDPQNWMQDGWSAEDRSDTSDLIRANDGPFKHHLDRYKYASRYDETAKRGDVDTVHKAAAEAIIQTLETRLEKAPYLLGNQQTLVDIALFPFIRQFANTDRDGWAENDFRQTRDWLERHVTAPLFIDIMQKHPLWDA